MEMNVMNGTYFNGDNVSNFNFYTNLSAPMKLKFVDSVVGVLVGDNYYNYIIKDIIFDFYLIDIFTDVDTSELKESIAFLNDVEDFLYRTNIVDIVRANAEVGLIEELNTAVEKSIQYLTGIHPNPLNEALASLLTTLENKLNEVDLESMMGMAQKFAGMTEDFTMENMINTYMNSDIHKKNLIEIAESKKQRAEFANDMDKAIKLVNKDSK
jgi:hypothetical protein